MQRREKEKKKNLQFLHRGKRSHKLSGVPHLRWRYIPLGPPARSITRSIVVPCWHRVKKKEKENRKHTFVMTAIEAKEFPKFIPMTVCKDGISIGFCALPFRSSPLRDILRL